MNNQEEMATFLIDNGIDTEFKCCRVVSALSYTCGEGDVYIYMLETK